MGNPEEWDDELAAVLAMIPAGERKSVSLAIQASTTTKELRRNGKVIIRLTHESGVTVDKIAGASRDQTYRDAFLELLEKVSQVAPYSV